MAPYRSPFTFLPDEHMRLVGIISAHWETVDLLLERAVAEVTMHEFTQVQLLTDAIGFRTKIDLLMAYARPLKDGDPDMWKEFTRAFEAVKEAYTKRNMYVHAKWNAGDAADMPTRNSSRVSGGTLKIECEPTSVTELENAADAVFKAGETLMLAFQKCGLLTS